MIGAMSGLITIRGIVSGGCLEEGSLAAGLRLDDDVGLPSDSELLWNIPRL